jgi:hypothetical protein
LIVLAQPFVKANIRLNKIRERNLKPHYNHLTPQQKAFVKAFEAVRQCEIGIGKMDMGNDKNWRRTEFGGLLLEAYSKAIDRKIRLSNELNLETEAQENELYNSCHNSRFYGGSF